MATVVLTMANPIAVVVGDALGERHGFTGFESDNVTPQTKLEFFRKHLMKYLKNEVALHRAGSDGRTAYNAALANVESTVIIT